MAEETAQATTVAERDESDAEANAGVVSLWRRRSTRAAVVLCTAVLVMSGILVLPHETAAPARPGMVHVASLTPTYHGQPITWPDVWRLQDRRLGGYVEIYSDDAGDHAYVFDTQAENTAWMCSLPVNKNTSQCQER